MAPAPRGAPRVQDGDFSPCPTNVVALLRCRGSNRGQRSPKRGAPAPKPAAGMGGEQAGRIPQPPGRARGAGCCCGCWMLHVPIPVTSLIAVPGGVWGAPRLWEKLGTAPTGHPCNRAITGNSTEELHLILLTSESKSKPERGICEQLVELCGPTGKVQREAARGRGRTAGDPLRDAGSLGGTSEAKPGNLGLCGKIKENNVTCWLRVKAPAAFGQERRGQGQWRHPRAQGIGAANPVPLQGFGSRRPPRCSLQELRKAQSGSASWGQSIFVQRLVLCSHEGLSEQSFPNKESNRNAPSPPRLPGEGGEEAVNAQSRCGSIERSPD
ncbi:hypothetical protein Anapl_16599 [Anas platyrhynchos]|uniref:Uncharacterized protein n=1 Tax=Anas platyrhynchos TaxID=8839 RepID=R0KXS8_ANAPL|nr:hypothetical protein Anapl_16599 [Anas platyrhynchos]